MLFRSINSFIQSAKEIDDNIFPFIANKKDFVAGRDNVYYSGPYWDDLEAQELIYAVLKGKWLSSGEKVNKFEREFSNKFGFNHSVMVNSGSSANLVMIAGVKKHLKWEDGSEVIVSPVGFPTTIAPLVQNNLKPVFVDIEFDTLNFDIWKIEEDRKSTRLNSSH